MSEVTTVEARKKFSEMVSRSSYGKERIVVKRSGKPAMAMVPIEDLQTLERIEDEMDLAEARKAIKGARKSGTIPWNKVKADLKLK